MLKEGGITPKNHIIDNEISEAYKETIKIQVMEHELVTPVMHRRNVEKKAI